MSNRFFRLLWRFNALAIAVCGLLGLFVGSIVAVQLARDVFRMPYQARDIARTNTEAPAGGANGVQEKLSVSSFSRINGTHVLWAPVTVDQTYDYRYSSKEAASTRNYVLYDTATGTTRSLLDNNRQIVLEARELRRPESDMKAPLEALFFALVENDSNGDGLLTSTDKISIALCRPDGQGLTKIGKAIGRTIGELVSDDGRTLIVMQDDNGHITATHIDLPSFKVTKTDNVRP
jgi:hypothetical protein